MQSANPIHLVSDNRTRDGLLFGLLWVLGCNYWEKGKGGGVQGGFDCPLAWQS